jgi:hypothetical protein
VTQGVIQKKALLGVAVLSLQDSSGTALPPQHCPAIPRRLVPLIILVHKYLGFLEIFVPGFVRHSPRQH